MNTLKNKSNKDKLGIKLATGVALAAAAIGGFVGVSKHNDEVNANELEKSKQQISQVAKDIGEDIINFSSQKDGLIKSATQRGEHSTVSVLVMEDGTLLLSEFNNAGQDYSEKLEVSVPNTSLDDSPSADLNAEDVEDALAEAANVSITYSNVGDKEAESSDRQDNGFRYWVLDSNTGGISSLGRVRARTMNQAELNNRIDFIRQTHEQISSGK
jgi:hypothetical protein